MAEILGLNRLMEGLQDKLEQAQRDDDLYVTVGYTAEYALWIHENKEIWPPGMRLKGKPRPKGHVGLYWDPAPQSGPKFLEGPARELARTLGDYVAGLVRGGAKLMQALYLAGLVLQKESQARVPVDSGNLRASAFTKVERAVYK